MSSKKIYPERASQFELIRDTVWPDSTTGTLKHLKTGASWFTLEDAVRDRKIPGETCIPSGVYQLRMTMSPRFGRVMPILLRVPGFEGVRVHAGNWAKDTEGCILLGKGLVTAPQRMLQSSRKAVNEFEVLLREELTRGEVWMRVVDVTEAKQRAA